MTFTQKVAGIRAAHPVFRRRRFFDGLPVRQAGAEGVPDIAWFRQDGSEMTDADWGSGFGRSVATYLNGNGIPDRDARGERVVDDSFVLIFNAHHDSIDFTMPPAEFGESWELKVDTDGAELPEGEPLGPQGTIRVGGRSLVVLQAVS
jgi:glycogen operon protein